MNFLKNSLRNHLGTGLAATLMLSLWACGGGSQTPSNDPPPVSPTPIASMGSLIPVPSSVTPTGQSFTLQPGAGIYVEPGNDEVKAIGQALADRLNPSTGLALTVSTAVGNMPAGSIHLTLSGTATTLGDEGYQLTVNTAGVTLNAYKAAGLFRGIQTLRQMLPATIESPSPQTGPWTMNTGSIQDIPRFPWRGAMLDVSRHFFQVADVKRFLDLMAAYKLNVLHLHLADDQGWRIEITSRPTLASIGGSTEVGGGAGGYYTQAQFANLVAYAAARYITIVPEVEMPGHCNAALASIPSLNGNGTSPALYTGTNVGFSSFCIGPESTYTFVDDVVKELATITPGSYLHMGGDEAAATLQTDYIAFMNRVGPIVENRGKHMMGWEEIAKGTLPAGTVVQHWSPWDSSLAQQAATKGAKVVMSPANKAYLDMQYDASTPLGQHWAAYVEVSDAYQWDPANLGVAESSVLGVEAPLWSETLVTMSDIEYMAFPRLCGIAEIGWSPVGGRNWNEYKIRLGVHGLRLAAQGVNFYHSAMVPWK